MMQSGTTSGAVAASARASRVQRWARARCAATLATCVVVHMAGEATWRSAVVRGQDAANAPARLRPRPLPDPEKVHDPSSVLLRDGVRRCFGTGQGLVLLRAYDDGRWLPEGRIFADGAFPAWHRACVPGNRGHLWAPDVIEQQGQYWVYYSVSTFGQNRSAIGLAVGASLDPASPDWRWEDRGPVLVSASSDRFNAIDPAIFLDPSDGRLWMAFGSFWDGIHLIELDPATGLQRDAATSPQRLAWAPEIEAPFLHVRDGQYYLFVNWGKCCRGAESTYEIRVGRSRRVEGPYVDRAGRPLLEGGGTPVLATEGPWIGPGHASIDASTGRELLVHHYYDGRLEGRSRLRAVPLAWDDQGWPQIVVETP